MRQHPVAIFAAILSQSFISVAFAAEAPPAAGSAVAKIGEKMPPMDTVPPTFADVAYGPGTGQRLWFWQAKSDKPTPLIMNIHGGGWMHGPREVFSHGDHRYLEQGISVAHITYTFSQAKPLPTPVLDAARALQFLRSKAAEWNLDPKRVIVTGFSAGGCTALWLATHDDLANPQAADPVERQSTRVNGAMVGAAQTSIEPENVRQWVGQEGIDHGMLRTAGGFKTNEEMFKAVAEKPEVARLYWEFSPINHLTPDDPPIMLGYGKAEMGKGGLHGGAFGLKFKEKADAVGMKQCYLKIDNDKDRYPGYPGGGSAFVKTIFNLLGK
jgi:acetyl esterase/lipase